MKTFLKVIKKLFFVNSYQKNNIIINIVTNKIKCFKNFSQILHVKGKYEIKNFKLYVNQIFRNSFYFYVFENNVS